jgi:hypothetical protein
VRNIAEETSPKPRNRHERRAVAVGQRAATQIEPAAWRVDAWLVQVPISRSKFYEERNAGRIETVKVGSTTLVTTGPRDYLSGLRDRALGNEVPPRAKP